MAFPQQPGPAYPDPYQSFAYGTDYAGGWGLVGGAGPGGGITMGPGGLAGGGATSVGAFPRARAQLGRTAVLGAGAWTFAPGAGIVLSQSIDDAMLRMGPRVYELMLCDDMVKSSIDALKLGALAGGVQAIPALKPKPGERLEDGDRKHKVELARKLSEECQRLTDRMPSLYDSLEEMLDGVVYGTAMAEKTWAKASDGPDKGKMILSSFVMISG